MAICLPINGCLWFKPAELRNLRIQDGVNVKELWSIYRKSKGGLKGDKTEPRNYRHYLLKMLMVILLIGSYSKELKLVKSYHH